MDNNNEKHGMRASVLNAIFMTLIWLTVVVTLSIGLAFFFLVSGNVGYGIGIAMYIVAGLVLLVGQYVYWKNVCKIGSCA